MTSTELALKRTLTDILEDELYNLNVTNSHHNHSSTLPSKTKNVLELAFPSSFEELMINESGNENNNSSGSHYWSSSSALPSKAGLPLNEDSGQQANHQEQQEHQGHQEHQHYDYQIFNKYADPSLTTTSSRKNTISNSSPNVKTHNKAAPTTFTTPVQKTVNLNSVMKIANPFNTMRSQLPYDVRVTNDFIDSADSIYAPQAGDELVGYDESYNSKMYWPLQDNSMALSNEDARMIFDHEFAADDDDLSDEEEEEEDERLKEERKADIYSIPFDQCYDIQKAKNNVNGKVLNTCNFVDSNMLNEPYNGNASNYSSTVSDEAVIDEDEDESNLIDEDELYEPSYRNNRKESVVFNSLNEIDKPMMENTPPVPSVSVLETFQTSKSSSRRRTSNNTNTPSPAIAARRKMSGYKKQPQPQSQSQSPSPQAHTCGETPNGNEIYTCMIMNAITRHPCSAQFSRSYDLTRHQNTIHAKKKTVFRCSECIRLFGHEGYQKTFSRLDALTRHIKSKHEDLSLEQRQEVTKYAKENIGYVVG